MWNIQYEIRCYRRLSKVKWQDHVTNNEARSQVRQWTVMDTIRQKKLQLFTHICRMPDDRLLKTLMLGMVEGERQPGRPTRRWINDVLVCCDKDVKEAVMMTEDWDNWRRFGCYGHRDHGIRRRRRRHKIGSEGRVSELFCAVLCNTIVRNHNAH